MSGRDDSILHTGMSSASLTTPVTKAVQDKRAEVRQERLDTQHKLKPAGEVVLQLIAKHKANAQHVQAVALSDEISDRDAGEMLRSQRKIYAFLTTFEQEIRNKLKEVE